FTSFRTTSPSSRGAACSRRGTARFWENISGRSKSARRVGRLPHAPRRTFLTKSASPTFRNILWVAVKLRNIHHFKGQTMRRMLTLALVLAVSIIAPGCGNSDGKLRTKGRLLKGGEEYVPDEGEYIQITFVPIPTDGQP